MEKMTHSNWNSMTPAMQMLQNIVLTYPSQYYVQPEVPPSSQIIYERPTVQENPTILLDDDTESDTQSTTSIITKNAYNYSCNMNYISNHSIQTSDIIESKNSGHYFSTNRSQSSNCTATTNVSNNINHQNLQSRNMTGFIHITNQQTLQYSLESPCEMNQSIKVEENLEITESKVQFPNCDQIKSEPDFDWTELNVKEDPEVFDSSKIAAKTSVIKSENENWAEVKEWIDWTELNIKREVKQNDECFSQEATNENCILISDESDTEPNKNLVKSHHKEVANDKSVINHAEKATEPNRKKEAQHMEAANGNDVSQSNSCPKQTPINENKFDKIVYKGAVSGTTNITVNPEQKGELKCDYCPYKTNWMNCLSRHVITKHKFIELDSDDNEQNTNTRPKTNGDEKFKCEHCSYRTNWKGNMTKHVISRHMAVEEIQWFKCAHCPYKGKTKEYLRWHLTSAHEKCVKWHECNHCSFRSKQKHILSKHIIVNHTATEDIKWFKCKHCPYKGKLSENLRNHMRTNHTNDSDIKWFECEKCSYKSKIKKNLKYHVINKHTNNDQIQWFRCDKCSHQFKTSKLLKYHTKTCYRLNIKKSKVETREIPVVIGNKICFKRVPVEIPLKDRVVQVEDKLIPVKEMLCKCKHCTVKLS